MDPMSGRIYKANNPIAEQAMEQSVKKMLEGDDSALVPIPEGLSAKVHAMTQEERLAWAAQERERLRAKYKTKNQRKALRRARRRKGRR